MSFDIKFTRQGFKNAIVESQSLLSDSTCVREAEAGKLDIKRHKPGRKLISDSQCQKNSVCTYKSVCTYPLKCQEKNASENVVC